MIAHDSEMLMSRDSSSQTWFISRHAGAVEWARRQGIHVDRVLEHLDIEQISTGDRVIGTLPVHLVADVCSRGAHYLHLSIDLSPELRGSELTADELDRCHARLEEFRVERL